MERTKEDGRAQLVWIRVSKQTHGLAVHNKVLVDMDVRMRSALKARSMNCLLEINYDAIAK